MDVSIVNVALPSVQSSLHAGSTALQLMVAGYTLTFGLMLVPAGRLGDAGRRRPILLGGLIVFAAASLAAALAPTGVALAIARLVQGAAAGVMNPQGMGLTQQVFRKEERGRAFGFNGAVIGISNTLGRSSAAASSLWREPRPGGGGSSASACPSHWSSSTSPGASCRRPNARPQVTCRWTAEASSSSAC